MKATRYFFIALLVALVFAPTAQARITPHRAAQAFTDEMAADDGAAQWAVGACRRSRPRRFYCRSTEYDVPLFDGQAVGNIASDLLVAARGRRWIVSCRGGLDCGSRSYKRF